MSKELKVAGIILCGGKSSRMGQPKHLLPYGDQLVLQRIVDTVLTVFDRVVVVAAKNQNLPVLPESCDVIRDEEEFQGPLYGLLKGLEYFQADRPDEERTSKTLPAERSASVEAVYLTGCDVPLLKPEFITRVIKQLGNAEIAVVQEETYYHPLAAVYRTELYETVADLISAGERRPRALFEIADVNPIQIDSLKEVDPELDSLRNMNTPEEYAELLQKNDI